MVVFVAVVVVVATGRAPVPLIAIVSAIASAIPFAMTKL